MITVDDIRNVTFEKGMRGYRVAEVDEYLDTVSKEIEKLAKEKSDSEKKVYVLAEKVDQYRKDEDTLKTALLNAQRLGETVVYEAKQKAENIIFDANNKANQIREEAERKVSDCELTVTRLQAEVTSFKNEVLGLYKQHIECLSNIPGVDEAKTATSLNKKLAQQPSNDVEQENKPQRHGGVENIKTVVQPDEPLMMEPRMMEQRAAEQRQTEQRSMEPASQMVFSPSSRQEKNSFSSLNNDEEFGSYQGIRFD